MNNTLRAELIEQAKVIWQQISVNTKMACGAREAFVDVDNGKPYLCFKVTIKPGTRHAVKVWLEPSDTYTVVLIAQRGLNVKEQERKDDIYCDNLSEIIYHMCNK